MVVFNTEPRNFVETRTMELADAAWWLRVARDQAGYLEVMVLTRDGMLLAVVDTAGGQATMRTYDKGRPRGTHPADWRG